ncbi:MAG TPA: hypothetical protein PKV44_05355, partial [Bacillota bacterium]|nr:hypothetical protein [Bacillota bacterium]
MNNVIEFKKHSQQINDSVESAIYRNNRPLKRVHDFGCPVPLYSDEEGKLFTAFYDAVKGSAIVIPFYDGVESMAKHEKKS